MTTNTNDALAEYANPLNWDADANGVRRIWREPGSDTPDAYNGFEMARAALTTAAAVPPASRHAENAALLADILNRRPAMNDGLVEAYMHWTSEVYDLMGAMAAEPANDGSLAAAPKTEQDAPQVGFIATLLTALGDAAQSLESIQLLAGKDTYMMQMDEVRMYAGNRARAARGVQARLEEAHSGAQDAPQPAVQQGGPVVWRSWDSENSRWNFTLWPDEWAGHADAWEPLYTQPAAPAAQGAALPVAAKSHGAWDGLETLADLPDGTELYAHPPAAQGDALDAERYRWLRARWGRTADEYDGDSDQLVAIRESDSHFAGWDVDPVSLDRAIDAARSQAKEGA